MASAAPLDFRVLKQFVIPGPIGRQTGTHAGGIGVSYFSGPEVPKVEDEEFGSAGDERHVVADGNCGHVTERRPRYGFPNPRTVEISERTREMAWALEPPDEF
jgi:hypothetical protein